MTTGERGTKWRTPRCLGCGAQGSTRSSRGDQSPGAKFLPATHAVLSGPAEIEEYFAGLFANGVAGHALRVMRSAATASSSTAPRTGWRRPRGRTGLPRRSAAPPLHIFERQGDGRLKLKLHTSTERRGSLGSSRVARPGLTTPASSSTLASRRSGVSKPSVNQP